MKIVDWSCKHKGRFNKSMFFLNFGSTFSPFPLRNRYIPFKCPLYNFLRAFKWYTSFFIKINLKFSIFWGCGQSPVINGIVIKLPIIRLLSSLLPGRISFHIMLTSFSENFVLVWSNAVKAPILAISSSTICNVDNSLKDHVISLFNNLKYVVTTTI